VSDRLATDPKREATDAIRGYVYQAYQSLWAWIRLRDDENLYLEAAEDFDISSPAEVVTTQVKNVSRPVTLRSTDVVAALNHFWEHRRKNQDRRIRFRFLTTAAIGGEMGAPLDRPGLDYWKEAATGAIPIAPLRSLLCSLALDADLQTFITNAADEQLRLELFERVVWDTGARPIEAIRATLQDELVLFGSNRGINSLDSAKALGSLLETIAVRLSERHADPLRRVDFIKKFDEITLETIPRGEAAALRAAAAAPSRFGGYQANAPQLVLGSSLPLVRGAAIRKTLVDDLAQVLRRTGALFLYGSTGLGKTSLARLLADHVKLDFRWAGFRAQTPELVAERLREARCEVASLGTAAHLVLDDLDLSKIDRFESEFLSLGFEVLRRSGHLIVTGHSPCAADLLDKLWISPECQRSIPYLEALDISEVLKNHGAVDQGYIDAQSKLILATTSGHPQLVHARARKLQAAQWPAPSGRDLLAVEPIADVKTSARRRLLEEFPSDAARALAFRLSMALGYFRRDHAIAVADVKPTIPIPGAQLDLLTGPWIENIDGDRLRVSPLLAQAGSGVLSADEVRAVHESLALVTVKQKSGTPEEVGTALLHALVAQSPKALLPLSEMLVKTKLASVPGLSESLLTFSLFSLERSERLYLADAWLEVMLRVVQFRAASANRQEDVAHKIIDRTLEVLDRVPDEVRHDTSAAAYYTFLSTVSFPIPARLSVPMLDAFLRLEDVSPDIAERMRSLYGPLGAKMLSPIQALFACEAARISGVESLVPLIAELSKLEPSHRKRLLETYDDCELSSQLVNYAWLQDLKRGELKADRAVDVFKQIGDQVAQWGEMKLDRACSVAAAVMHDEYLDDQTAALEELDLAVEKYGGVDYRIAIGRGKVLLGKREYGAALLAFEAGLADPSVGGLDRLYALRFVGICCAHNGDWTRSASSFLAGAEIARGHAIVHRMAIGLEADAAYACWRSGEMRATLQTLVGVLKALDQVPIDADLRNRHVHALIRHLVAWIWASDAKSSPFGNMAEPIPGMCSNQDPHEGLARHAIHDLHIIWGLLADLDVRHETGLNIGAMVRAMEQGPAPIILQVIERTSAFERLKDGRGLENVARIVIRVLESAEFRPGKRLEGFQRIDIPTLPSSYWADRSHRAYLARQFCAAAIVITADGDQLPINKWREQLLEAGAVHDDFDRWLSIMADAESIAPPEGFDVAASALARLRRGNLDLRTQVQVHAQLLSTIFGGDAESIGGEALARLVAASWAEVAENQRFALISPGLTGPRLLLACSDQRRHGLPKVAAVLLEASKAVGVPLSSEIQARMRAIADP